MDRRTRLFLWAGMALLAGLWTRPAGEVLAADWRGTASVLRDAVRVETAEGPSDAKREAAPENADGTAEAEENAAPATPRRERRS